MQSAITDQFSSFYGSFIGHTCEKGKVQAGAHHVFTCEKGKVQAGAHHVNTCEKGKVQAGVRHVYTRVKGKVQAGAHHVNTKTDVISAHRRCRRHRRRGGSGYRLRS